MVCHEPDENAANNRIIDAHIRSCYRKEMTKSIPEIYEEIRSDVKVRRPDIVKSFPKYESWQAHLYRE